MKNAGVVLLLFVMLSGSAFGAENIWDSGNAWLARCSDSEKNPGYLLSCLSFLSGYVLGCQERAFKNTSETIWLVRNQLISQSAVDQIAKMRVMYVCKPKGVNLGQINDIFMKYLKNNPEKRHEEAVVLLSEALQEAYPCSPEEFKQKVEEVAGFFRQGDAVVK